MSGDAREEVAEDDSRDIVLDFRSPSVFALVGETDSRDLRLALGPSLPLETALALSYHTLAAQLDMLDQSELATKWWERAVRTIETAPATDQTNEIHRLIATEAQASLKACKRREKAVMRLKTQRPRTANIESRMRESSLVDVAGPTTGRLRPQSASSALRPSRQMDGESDAAIAELISSQSGSLLTPRTSRREGERILMQRLGRRAREERLVEDAVSERAKEHSRDASRSPSRIYEGLGASDEKGSARYKKEVLDAAAVKIQRQCRGSIARRRCAAIRKQVRFDFICINNLNFQTNLSLERVCTTS